MIPNSPVVTYSIMYWLARTSSSTSIIESAAVLTHRLCSPWWPVTGFTGGQSRCRSSILSSQITVFTFLAWSQTCSRCGCQESDRVVCSPRRDVHGYASRRKPRSDCPDTEGWLPLLIADTRHPYRPFVWLVCDIVAVTLFALYICAHRSTKHVLLNPNISFQLSSSCGVHFHLKFLWQPGTSNTTDIWGILSWGILLPHCTFMVYQM